MAQWPPPFLQQMPVTPPLPAQIPKEWEKANEALQAVRPQSKGNSTDPTIVPQNQNGGMNDFAAGASGIDFGANDNDFSARGFQWSNQQMFTYPHGYTGYPHPPGYGYFNYGFNYPAMNSNPYFGATPFAPQIPPMPSTLPEAKFKDEKKQGPPESGQTQPPQTPTTSSSADSDYFSSISTQAPGTGGIKFNLPKKKNKKNAFQTDRDMLQERMNNNFRKGNAPMQNKSEIQQQNMAAQKSVSTMAADSWPPSLKNYVARCFEKCKSDIDKDQVEIMLKGKLLKANSEGTLKTRDWDNEPLPNIHSERLEQEQKQEILRKSPILLKKMPEAIRNQGKKPNPFIGRNSYQSRNRNHLYHSRSRSRSHSRSRSRSRSPPPRKVIRRRRYSSSSESSGDSRGSFKKTLSSSVIGPSDSRTPKNSPNNSVKNKKKRKKGNKAPFSVDPEFCTDERLLKRAARFEPKGQKNPKTNFVFTASTPFVIDVYGDDMEWSSDAVVGTCLDLEKPFLRLTGAVDPSSVRPEEVLVKSLNMVKKHWIENQDYHFACEQLKSIRQDLVVQCIRNRLTVQVYETHARIALEKGDHTEFNQCQSQLKVLYQEVNEQGNRLEFIGYHILYTMFTENDIELKNILAELKTEEKSDEVVSHALKISKACASNNYYRFFKLYLMAPMMSSFIIDWYIERIRKTALKAIIKSFRPNLPVSHIQSALAFPSTEECLAFLTKLNIVFSGADSINCKESVKALANL